MSVKPVITEIDKKRKEQDIILKILRLLNEEQLISLEEEVRGEEICRRLLQQ